MTYKEFFKDIDDWLWKLEINPETNKHELFLGIPNDWVYSTKNDSDVVQIQLIHELEDSSIIKIFTEDDDLDIDDVILTAKSLISKNKELEKRKEAHRLEMEKIKDMLIEKEKNFLEYVDKVKDNSDDEEEEDVATDTINEVVKEVKEAVKETVAKKVVDKTSVKETLNEEKKKDDFMEDIEKLKLK